MHSVASRDSGNSCITRNVTAGGSHKTARGLSNGASHKNIRLSIRVHAVTYLPSTSSLRCSPLPAWQIALRRLFASTELPSSPMRLTKLFFFSFSRNNLFYFLYLTLLFLFSTIVDWNFVRTKLILFVIFDFLIVRTSGINQQKFIQSVMKIRVEINSREWSVAANL